MFILHKENALLFVNKLKTCCHNGLCFRKFHFYLEDLKASIPYLQYNNTNSSNYFKKNLLKVNKKTALKLGETFHLIVGYLTF